MFFFNKPKTRLADLIPQGYVDIHSHLLPGIDDGAKDNAHTVSLIKNLMEYGFEQFITTPHVLTGVWNNTTGDIKAKESATKEHLAQLQLPVPLKAGAEYLMDDVFLNLIKTEPLLTLKDNYVLIEMSYISPPSQLYDIIFNLQIEGYKPILAHPERYLFYHGKPQEYAKLKKAGCLFQLNLLSVTGYYGKQVLRISKELLDEKMINFTGSDTHHGRHTEAFKNIVSIKNTTPLQIALNNNSLFRY